MEENNLVVPILAAVGGAIYIALSIVIPILYEIWARKEWRKIRKWKMSPTLPQLVKDIEAVQKKAVGYLDGRK